MLCVPKLDYNHLFVVSTFLIFVVPMSIITILYILIGLQLRRSKIVHRASPSCNNVRLKVSYANLSPEVDILFIVTYIKWDLRVLRVNNEHSLDIIQPLDLKILHILYYASNVTKYSISDEHLFSPEQIDLQLQRYAIFFIE